jgi:hypothetical protein
MASLLGLVRDELAVVAVPEPEGPGPIALRAIVIAIFPVDIDR